MAAEEDGSNNGLIVTITLSVTFAVVAIVLAAQGLYFHYERAEEDRKIVEQPYKPLQDLRAAQKDALKVEGERKDDKGAPVLNEQKQALKTIPLDAAIKQVLEERGAK